MTMAKCKGMPKSCIAMYELFSLRLVMRKKDGDGNHNSLIERSVTSSYITYTQSLQT